MKKGFTLIEVLLSISILTLIAATLLNFFYTGKLAYRKLDEYSKKETPAQELFQIIRRDLAGLQLWDDQWMVLNEKGLSFHKATEQGQGEICRVDYLPKERYEGDKKVYDIERREILYPYPKEEDSLKPRSKFMVIQGCDSISIRLLAMMKLPKSEQNDPKNTPGNPEERKMMAFSKWEFKASPLALQIKIKLNENEPVQKWLGWLPLVGYQDLNKTTAVAQSDLEKESVEEVKL
jgi:prepilin-type N-terminal cleavage/methylation domain-containing protein